MRQQPAPARVAQPRRHTTKAVGDAGEAQALAYLQAQGCRLVRRNYRTPGRGGGEIDLIVRDPDGSLVFVEVRQRARTDHGGALASITWHKRQRIVYAARCYLNTLAALPPCRFDVVVIEPTGLQWLRGAFEA